ncbi:PRC-barrel domain-containing protein [Pedobacter sp. L105]|uniref:PRC-barrel domain-containing protein n=1 Tax=Pedobacter sp. L105 TaxID=1641871 RepID=UPI00131B55D8|nr:PRC-barrel domain-containing protein [Pedobacter sp. L105]
MERKENEHQIRNLKELSSSDFEVKDGQPDIISWKVLNSGRQYVGTVSELLFDEQEQKVRYLVLNLEGNSWKIEEREVLIPIGVAELDVPHDFVILPNITAQQISVLPDYTKGNVVISADSQLYGHKDFDESNLYAKRQSGSYQEHIPFQVITRIYQEENEAENAFSMLIENGIEEKSIKVTPYNPLNSVTDLQGNTNTEFIGDGSRDEYILSIAAQSVTEAELIYRLLGPETT